MKIKLSDYIHCLPSLKRALELKSDVKQVAVEFSATSGVPIIIVYKMILDLGHINEYINTRLKEMYIEQGDEIV